MYISPSGRENIGIKKVAMAHWYHWEANLFRNPFCLGSNMDLVAFILFLLFLHFSILNS